MGQQRCRGSDQELRLPRWGRGRAIKPKILAAWRWRGLDDGNGGNGWFCPVRLGRASVGRDRIKLAGSQCLTSTRR